jgi:hypothetical protein
LFPKTFKVVVVVGEATAEGRSTNAKELDDERRQIKAARIERKDFMMMTAVVMERAVTVSRPEGMI